jgi:hypothetical protein
MRLVFALLCFITHTLWSQHLDTDDIERRTAQIKIAFENKIRLCNIYARDSIFAGRKTPRNPALLVNCKEFLHKTIAYDTNGFITTEIEYNRTGDILNYTTYTYVNGVFHSTVTRCDDGGGFYTTVYDYDSLGKCICVMVLDETWDIRESRGTSYSFDSLGNIWESRYDSKYGVSSYFSYYDDQNRKVLLTFDRGSYTYMYDKNGRTKVWLVEYIKKNGNEQTAHYYRYDKEGHIVHQKYVNLTEGFTIRAFRSRYRSGNYVSGSTREKGMGIVSETRKIYSHSGLLQKTIQVQQPTDRYTGEISIWRYDYLFF